MPNTQEETVFPLKKAYVFAAAHGVGKEASDIQSMDIPWSRCSSVRRWHMIKLFRGKGLLVQFYQQYWPRGATDFGERQERRYLRVKGLWDQRQSR